MTDKKLSDNEIIKALECCINTDCVNCPNWSGKWYRGMCNDFLPNVLDLINRQKAEIEELKAIVFMDRTEAIKNLKAEAIKDFAERLKERCDAPHWCVWLSDIDDVLEEMVGEDK